jgi:flagellar basal-body rod protein FlgB
MQPTRLFSTAFAHNHWLATRQSATAANIANINTPVFRALGVAPFEAALANAGSTAVAKTDRNHMDSGAAGGTTAAIESQDADAANHSGNSVRLEAELMNAGETNRALALNAGILKSFHRMILQSVKG